MSVRRLTGAAHDVIHVRSVFGVKGSGFWVSKSSLLIFHARLQGVQKCAAS